jgi:hypothetical protein
MRERLMPVSRTASGILTLIGIGDVALSAGSGRPEFRDTAISLERVEMP